MNVARTSDEVFVAAPREAVYGAVAGLGAQPSWWPGARIARRDDLIKAVLRSAPGRRRVRLDGTVTGVRTGQGLYWRLDRGSVRGHVEWWLEPFKSGTIVHVFLEMSSGSATMPIRIALRRGMNALKDRLEGR